MRSLRVVERAIFGLANLTGVRIDRGRLPERGRRASVAVDWFWLFVTRSTRETRRLAGTLTRLRGDGGGSEGEVIRRCRTSVDGGARLVVDIDAAGRWDWLYAIVVGRARGSGSSSSHAAASSTRALFVVYDPDLASAASANTPRPINRTRDADRSHPLPPATATATSTSATLSTPTSSTADTMSTTASSLEPLFTLVAQSYETLETAFYKVPGSAVIARYVKSSHRDDPGRTLLEVILIIFAIRTLLQSRTKAEASGKHFIEFSEKASTPLSAYRRV